MHWNFLFAFWLQQAGGNFLPDTNRTLSIQEQKTKIAFLENEQAELETEIRMLRNKVKLEEETDQDEISDDAEGTADRLFELVSSSRRSQSFDNLTKMVKKELELSSSLDQTLLQLHNNP